MQYYYIYLPEITIKLNNYYDKNYKSYAKVKKWQKC